MFRLILPGALLLTSLVTGCVTVTNQNQANAQPQTATAGPRHVRVIDAVAPPCFLTKREAVRYAKAAPVRLTSLIPQKAKEEKVEGCAGVKFQLDANGSPVHAQVIQENPLGYDFGETKLRSLKESTFEPPADPDQWYYSSTTYKM